MGCPPEVVNCSSSPSCAPAPAAPGAQGHPANGGNAGLPPPSTHHTFAPHDSDRQDAGLAVKQAVPAASQGVPAHGEAAREGRSATFFQRPPSCRSN